MDAFPTDRQWRLNEDAPLPTQGVTAWPGITQSCMPPDDAEGHGGGGGDVWCAERNAGPEEVIRKGTEFYNLKVVCHVRLRCPASVTRVLSETPTS